MVVLAATTGPAAAPAVPDIACGAVTRSQIEAAVGVRLTSLGGDYSNDSSTCSYSAGDIAVTITVQHPSGSLDLPAELRSLQHAFPTARVREVTGLAQWAFALEIPAAGTQVHVLRGDGAYLLVSVLGVTRSLDAALKITRALLGL